MRFSQSFIPTHREEPADAQVMSHKLMVRAGMIRRVASGIYNTLPLGLRVIQKISKILREEMNRVGGQELSMPSVQPAELWIESGRWGEYGPELLRFKDRKQAEFCLGPTHEEIITTLVNDNVKSYRQLPLTLFQIQTKFRDEIRPRFGLMRGREFIMKDAYSFGVDEASAVESYGKMYGAYERIFERCGLRFRAVEADTGSIGGNRSHEFQVLADTGEDAIASCEACGYAANIEMAAIAHAEPPPSSGSHCPYEKVETAGKKTIEEVSSYLKVPASQLVKAVAFWLDETPVLALCRGDHEVNEVKLKTQLGKSRVHLMTDADVEKHMGALGYIGPVNIKSTVRIVADHAVNNANPVVVGSGQRDTHLQGVVCGRDFKPEFFDLRVAREGDPCGKCSKPFVICRGIEVGHIFYLGTKYSKAMKAVFLDAQGQEKFFEMGCYGIGVGRTAAAAIEQNHDDKGIMWPMPIAPYHVELLSLGKDEIVVAAADALYERLKAAGVEVLYDDRDERPGVKFADADLIGCPIRLMIGARSLKEGKVELRYRNRLADEPLLIESGDIVTYVKTQIEMACA